MRKLGIPSVIDRVLQQAIVQVLTPIYEEQFINSSFGFKPGHSCEQAVIKALECFNDGYDWMDIDLQSFFDEVNRCGLESYFLRMSLPHWIYHIVFYRVGSKIVMARL